MNLWGVEQYHIRNLNHSVRTSTGWLYSADLVSVYSDDYSSFIVVDQQNYSYIFSESHIPYINDHMTYFDGQEWQNQLGPGSAANVVVDAEGTLHASVGYLPTVGIAYRQWNGEWSEPEQVDVDDAIAQDTSIILDHMKRPSIAYATESTWWFPVDELRYAERSPTGWLTETVAIGVFAHVTIALDPQEQPYISYYDIEEGDLNVAVREEGVWQYNHIDWNNSIDQPGDIVIDNLGRIHVSYYDSANGDLMYALYTDQWHHTIVVSEGDVGSHNALALGPLNSPMIVYYDATLKDVMLATLPTEVVGVALLPVIAQP
jgi:hypothetical protein